MFQHSFCDPFKEDIIDLGVIGWESVLEAFDNIPWSTYLQKMAENKEEKIHQSPSLIFRNQKTTHEVSVSAVGNASSPEFYIFYKRPKEIGRFLGLLKTLDKAYLSEVYGQNRSDVLKVLQAFISGNYRYLDDKIK